ncbi:hypothetical protein E4U31_001361 [Claviceps sp. LM219 group G6]|nr:hypothetical protein E4U31_001361 [Claviceps sp. LM219 group G6]
MVDDRRRCREVARHMGLGYRDSRALSSVKSTIMKAAQDGLRPPRAGKATWASINLSQGQLRAKRIVGAVNKALKRCAAISARRLRSGAIAVTFRQNERPDTSHKSWVAIAFEAEAAWNGRLFEVSIKRIPARCTQNQEMAEIYAPSLH